MSIFKEIKPLIEWEKGLDSWVMDVELTEHFQYYNKIDAYNLLCLGVVKRGWESLEEEIYQRYLSNSDNIDLLVEEFKHYNGLQFAKSKNLSEKKTLIEWEKEIGLWFEGLDYIEHYSKCTFNDLMNLLVKIREIHKWNHGAQKMYDGLAEWRYFHPMCNEFVMTQEQLQSSEKANQTVKKTNPIGVNLELLKACKKKKIPQRVLETPIIEENKKSKRNFSSVIQNAFNRIKNNFETLGEQRVFNIVKKRKSKNKLKIKHSLIKKVAAVVLTLTTSLSAYSYSKQNTSYEENVSEMAMSDVVDNSNQENVAIEGFDSDRVFFNNKLNDLIKVDFKHITGVDDKEKNIEENSMSNVENNNISNIQISENVSIVRNESTQKKTSNSKEISKSKEIKSSNSSTRVDVRLHDKITIQPGSSIYQSSEQACTDENALPLYYSYSKVRDVDMVTFYDNGHKINTTTQEEYEECINKGMSIICVRTEDGYYREESVKVLRKA